MNFFPQFLDALRGRIKTVQTYKAKAQKVKNKWKLLSNSEIIETEKTLDQKGNELELKLYDKGRLMEHTVTSYDAMGNLLKRQVFRDIDLAKEEEYNDLLDLAADEEEEDTDYSYESEEETANAETDNENQPREAKLSLVSEEEHFYDEFNCLIKSIDIAQTSEPFGDYQEIISLTYNSAGKKSVEIKETKSKDMFQIIETTFNVWENPTQSTETINGLLESNTIYVYNPYQQELARTTVYVDQTTEEILSEYDECQNLIVEITSQRDGTASAIINKISYY